MTWILVSERLPLSLETVLYHWKVGEREGTSIGQLVPSFATGPGRGFESFMSGGRTLGLEHVTHWMQLPQPPAKI